MKRHASMNRVYRLVWSELSNTWVAVAESVRGRGKGSSRKLIAAALSLSAIIALAGPTGSQLVAGTGSISQVGNTTNIQQSSQNLSLNWQAFNIGAQETVNFLQPSASAVAVNRIFDTQGSQILGHLNANGQVWLINPNGILFGQGAQVNVGGLVASTLDLNDSSLNGNTRNFSGKGTGSVVNQGNITVGDGGYVALLGNTVSNQGNISAQLGTVALGAGSAVTLTFNGNSLVQMQVDQSTLNNLSENGGLLRADGGTVLMSAGAKNELLASVVNNTGVIEARTVESHEGVITLLGGMSAGTVNVGGTIDTSAPSGGNGGFVETSAARVKVSHAAWVTAAAPTGRYGTWLIDPQDLTISATGDIDGTTLSTMLGNANVAFLSSYGGTSGSGNINVNDAVSWSSNRTLILTASNNVNINANITATGNTAELVINPNTANSNGLHSDAASGTGTFNLGSGASITLSGTNPSLSIAGHSYTVINSLGAPYSTTKTDLQGINGDPTGYYALGSNIDATATSGWNSGAGFVPIGGSYTGDKFTGTFDGLGHSICNLNINWGTMYIGLFGYAERGAVIQNVGLIGANVTGNGDVGALAGYNAGIIKNSYATGTVTSANSAIGGLVGENAGATIDNSYATATVSGQGYVGGLVGYNNQANISCVSGVNCSMGYEPIGSMVTNSYATGSVTDSGGVVGGLVGNNVGGTIKDSFASGRVTGTGSNHMYAGGLVGINGNLNSSDGQTVLYYGQISNSHATGNVSSRYSVGGLAGMNYGTIANSYATGSANGEQFVGGLAGYNGTSYYYSDWTAVPFSYAAINNSYATGVVSGIHGVGGLVGESQTGTTISTSYAAGRVTGTQDRIGGLVGSSFGTVSNSYATGNVTGEVDVGGLVGLSFDAITNSGATGNVSGSAEVGGLTGTSYGSISNSFAKGNVTGGSSSLDIGGLAGRIWGSTIATSFASGGVTGGAGSSNLGGLVGLNAYDTGTIISGSWNTDLIAAGVGSGAAGGATGLATGAMPTATPFANFNFTSMPGATGNNWVVIDANGTLNNAGGATSATLPMLASEYSTTIRSAHQLQLMQMALSASYTLGADIDAVATGSSADVWGSSGFVPIGAPSIPFIGRLDGQSHTVSDLTINRPTRDYVGLLGILGADAITSASVSNLGLLNPLVTGQMSVGALVGYNYGGDVSNSYVIGGAVTGSFFVGGLAGNNDFGHAGSNSTIRNSYTSAGIVTGDNVVGGLSGNNGHGGNITNAYSSNLVSSPGIIGGLLGQNGGTVSKGYWDKTVFATGIGSIFPGSTPEVTGLSAAQMQQQSNFVSWDFTNNWLGYDGHSAPLLRSFMRPLTVTAASGIKSYDGLAFTESVTYCCTPGGTLPSGMGTVSYAAGPSYSFGATNAGNYTIAPGGLYSNQQGYIIGYVNGSLIINKAPLTVSTLDVTKTYDGSLAAAGTATVISGTLYSNSGNSGSMDSISGGNFAFTNANAGTNNKTVTVAAITVTDGNSGGNYNVTYADNTSSTINKAPLLISTLNTTKTYDGRPFDSALQAFGTAVVLVGNLYNNASNGGAQDSISGGVFAYTDKNVGIGNKAVTTTSVTVNDGSSGANYDVSYVNNNTSTITPKTITTTGLIANNKIYSGNATAILNTNLAAVTGGANADDDNKFYTGDAITLIVTGANGIFTTGKDVGMGKAVTVSGLALGNNAAGNYTLHQPTGVTANINKAHLTVTANNQTRLYGSSNPTFTETISGFVNGEVLATSGVSGTSTGSSGATTSTGVGSAIITGSTAGLSAANYDFTKADGTLTINKAHLTVTADNQARLYGSANPTFTETISGFVNGEVLATSGVSGTATGSSTATASTGVGNATITGSTTGLSAANYDFTKADGTLTINKAPLSITASNASKAYDSLTYSGGNGASYSGFVNGESSAVLNGTLAYSGTSQGAINAGSYVLTPGGLSSGNYALGYVNGTLTISAIALNAIGLIGSRVYDGTADVAAGIFTLSGLVSGEHLTLTGVGSVADKNVGVSKPVNLGSLTIGNGSGGQAINYTFSGGTQTASITPANVTLSSANVSKVYDGNLSAAGTPVLASGTLFGNDTLAGGSFAFTDKNVGNANKTVTANAITVNDGNGGANYTVSYANNTTSTITPKALTASVTAPDKVYDGNTTASPTLSITTGLVGTETVSATGTATFNTKDVTTANLVTVNSIALANGANGGLSRNYSLANGETVAAHITAKALTATVAAPDKVYDGNTTASPTLAVTTGLVGTETVNATGSATFNTKDVATANFVTVNSVALANGSNGGLASNYSLANGETVAARITPAPLLVTGINASNKMYDTTTAALLVGTATVAPLSSDVVNVGGVGAGAFADAAVGTGKAVTVSGYLLTGSGASNYAIGQPWGLTADITPPPAGNVPTELATDVFSPSADTRPDALRLLPTITVLPNADPPPPGADDSPLPGTNTVVNTMMTIGGGVGPSLQIIRGGMHLPTNMVHFNE